MKTIVAVLVLLVPSVLIGCGESDAKKAISTRVGEISADRAKLTSEILSGQVRVGEIDNETGVLKTSKEVLSKSPAGTKMGEVVNGRLGELEAEKAKLETRRVELLAKLSVAEKDLATLATASKIMK